MVPAAEYSGRRERLLGYIREKGLSHFLVFNPYNLFYLTRFFHVSTERPVVYALDSGGKASLLVPALEEAPARALSTVDRVDAYFEYPGREDALENFFLKLKGKKIRCDVLSLEMYRKISRYFTEADVSGKIGEMRLCKSEYEVVLLRKAAVYSDFIAAEGLRAVRPGMTEMELLSAIEQKTIGKMAAELDEIVYAPGGPAGGLVPSGERTAMPHALPSGRRIHNNEPLILSCGANVEGCRVETERSCFLGTPGPRYREAFSVMAEAQTLACSLLEPGVRCSAVNDEVLAFIRGKGFGEALRHRTGHGKGLEEHEPPWIESGDDTVLRPGMVVSAEPGLYIDGFAGFRHSDTVLITDRGAELLTALPRGIDELTLKI